MFFYCIWFLWSIRFSCYILTPLWHIRDIRIWIGCHQNELWFSFCMKPIKSKNETLIFVLVFFIIICFRHIVRRKKRSAKFRRFKFWIIIIMHKYNNGILKSEPYRSRSVNLLTAMLPLLRTQYEWIYVASAHSCNYN